MRKMTENEMRNSNGGKDHWYVLVCNRCGWAFQDSWLGALVATAHIKLSHGTGDYYFKDVCTAMGQPHSK